jgi:putative hydrolase of the HAD superfamily
VYTKSLGEIKAIALDIDGTLYRTWDLNFRMAFHFLHYNQFFLKYGLVRHDLHQNDILDNFTDKQAEYMSRRLKCSKAEAKTRLNDIVYDGLKHYFLKIKPCKGVKDFIIEAKSQGLKIALLSDFPPEQKGDLWGIKEYCDVILGTEEIGALKPSVFPFNVLAERLNVPASQVLYIGNSHKYDIVGSKNAGMKAAWFITPIRAFLHMESKLADISFYSYDKLKKILFEN